MTSSESLSIFTHNGMCTGLFINIELFSVCGSNSEVSHLPPIMVQSSCTSTSEGNNATYVCEPIQYTQTLTSYRSYIATILNFNVFISVISFLKPGSRPNVSNLTSAEERFATGLRHH